MDTVDSTRTVTKRTNQTASKAPVHRVLPRLHEAADMGVTFPAPALTNGQRSVVRSEDRPVHAVDYGDDMGVVVSSQPQASMQPQLHSAKQHGMAPSQPATAPLHNSKQKPHKRRTPSVRRMYEDQHRVVSCSDPDGRTTVPHRGNFGYLYRVNCTGCHLNE